MMTTVINEINSVFTAGYNSTQLQMPAPSVINLAISDIQNLLTTPIQLVAAPGNNLVVVPYLVIAYVKFVSAYSNGGTLQLKNGSGFVLSGTSITNGLTQGNSTINSSVLTFLTGKDLYSNFNNAGYFLSQTSGTAFSGGTSTMQIITYYYILKAN